MVVPAKCAAYQSIKELSLKHEKLKLENGYLDLAPINYLYFTRPSINRRLGGFTHEYTRPTAVATGPGGHLEWRLPRSAC